MRHVESTDTFRKFQLERPTNRALTSEELQKQINEFLARGGAVETVGPEIMKKEGPTVRQRKYFKKLET